MARGLLRSWKDLLPAAGGALITGALIVGAALAAIKLLKLFLAPADFPALTIVIAAIGATVAVRQLSGAADQRENTRINGLSFVASLVDKAVSTVGKQYSVKNHVHEHSLEILRTLLTALEQAEITSMPSVRAMTLLVDARACVANLVTTFEREAANNEALSNATAAAKTVSQEVRAELARLYPVYHLGKIVVARHTEHLPIDLND